MILKAYAYTIENLGLSEIKGPQNHPMIVSALELCRYDVTGVTDIDNIPWCSAWVNLAITCANIRINPWSTRKMLMAHGIPKDTIIKLFEYAGLPDDVFGGAVETHKHIIAPTFSAAASSWLNWGTDKSLRPGRGDLVVLKRKGGHHVAFLDEEWIHEDYRSLTDAGQKRFVSLLGGNQSDRVCSSDIYKIDDILSIRGT